MPLAAISLQTSQIDDPLLTADDVAHRLKVSTDWVWDHSSRRAPLLPVIRIGDGTLRYRQSQIEEFVSTLNQELSARARRVPGESSNSLIPVFQRAPAVPEPKRRR